MTKPLTPNEARGLKPNIIPPEVYEAFNELIVLNLDGRGVSVFKLDEVFRRLREKGVDTKEAVKMRWLDVEPFYREAGWKVTYDNPGWNETYPATFRFEMP